MIRIGIGGWTFPPWRGVFYPPGLPHAQELAYAAAQLTSIEINATFHGSQKPESFCKWRDAVPEGFVFSVKAPRYATWRRELGEAGPSIARFLDSGVTELGAKLGPMLWQLPPTRKFDRATIEPFLADGYPPAEPTADFVYARLKRNAAAEPEGYRPGALTLWQTKLTGWMAEDTDCFVYFIAGDKVYAPRAAGAMMRRLRGDTP